MQISLQKNIKEYTPGCKMKFHGNNKQLHEIHSGDSGFEGSIYQEMNDLPLFVPLPDSPKLTKWNKRFDSVYGFNKSQGYQRRATIINVNESKKVPFTRKCTKIFSKIKNPFK